MPFTHHPAQRDTVARVRYRQAARRAARRRCRFAALLSAAAMALAPALALPAGAASAAQAARPDLIITLIIVKELPGTPPYIAVDEATRAPGFVVKVVTKNIGDATAGESVTDLKLREKGETLWGKLDTVGKLTPGMYRTSTYVVDDLKADPGLLHAVATADYTMKIRESHENNNTKTRRPIPVIPRDWNVSVFQTTVNPGGGLSLATYAANGFYYRFSRFDESKKWFVYKAYGRINDKADLVGAGCEGHGSTHDNNDPWPGSGSELRIKGDLSQYSAGVDTRSEPALKFNITCTGGSQFPEQYGWNSLLTFNGTRSFPTMSPDETTLQGEGDVTTPLGPTKYTWTFNARLSGV